MPPKAFPPPIYPQTAQNRNCNYPRRHDFHPTATRRRHQPSHEIHAKGKVGGVDAKREQDLHSLDANVPRTWSPSLNGSSTAGKHLINRSS